MKGENMGKWVDGGMQGPIYVYGETGPSVHPDPNQYADMYPRASLTGNVCNAPVYVDAHAQMLAARVEGLEKELNGLQHVWGRVKALEAEVARLSTTKIVPPDAAYNLLRRCLNDVSPVSLLARDIAEFLRNR